MIEFIKYNLVEILVLLVCAAILFLIIYILKSKKLRHRFGYYLNYVLYKIGLKKSISRRYIHRIHVKESYEHLVELTYHPKIVINMGRAELLMKVNSIVSNPATGHYARQWYDENCISWLGTAVDTFKDQTDFLARITYHQLSKAMFPIGDLPKAEVRRLAEFHKLPSAHRHDSQGICFLGKINYNDYIKEYVGEKEGDIIEFETGKKLGKHKGFWFHTIGQRKGLGLGGGPWFVVKKDTEKNLIYVSKGYDPIAQYTNTIDLVDVMAMNPAIELTDGQRVRYKIRHQPGFNEGSLKITEKGWNIISDEAISGVAAGQFGVIYHATEPVVLGSGVIG